MNKFLIIALLLSSSWQVFSHSKIVEAYPVSEITPRVFVLHGPKGLPSVANKGFMNNPAFIIGDKGVIVVDPGSSVYIGRMLIKAIQKRSNLPVTHIFNTHVHGDHWLANHAFVDKWPGVTIYGHPNKIAMAHDGEAESWLATMDTLTEGLTKGTKAYPANSKSNDGDVYKIHGLTFKIHAPDNAHSKTDIMVELVEDSVVFLGDNVFYQRIGRLDDGTFKGNIEACNVALAINATHYVPGHGPTGGSIVVESYKRFLETIFNLTAKHYEDDKEDYEIKPLIDKQLTEFKNWDGYDGALGKMISLAILEIDASEE